MSASVTAAKKETFNLSGSLRADDLSAALTAAETRAFNLPGRLRAADLATGPGASARPLLFLSSLPSISRSFTFAVGKGRMLAWRQCGSRAALSFEGDAYAAESGQSDEAGHQRPEGKAVLQHVNGDAEEEQEGEDAFQEIRVAVELPPPAAAVGFADGLINMSSDGQVVGVRLVVGGRSPEPLEDFEISLRGRARPRRDRGQLVEGGNRA